MEPKDQVLEAMKKAGEPVNAGKIVELTGMDRKVVDKVMNQLKTEGLIESPKRCYWAPKK
ncbi:MAG: MarR family transcriptional regulator [Microbacter sp.]